MTNCKCGGVVYEGMYCLKSGQAVYFRKCAACKRMEKSTDGRNWVAPADLKKGK